MKKTRILAAVFAVLIAAVMFFAGRVPAHADGEDGPLLIAENPAESADHTTGTKAIASAAVVGIAAAAGALAMGLAVSKSTESMARQPETAGQINSSMMLGMVFIETAIIYALIVAILIIFVL